MVANTRSCGEVARFSFDQSPPPQRSPSSDGKVRVKVGVSRLRYATHNGRATCVPFPPISRTRSLHLVWLFVVRASHPHAGSEYFFDFVRVWSITAIGASETIALALALPKQAGSEGLDEGKDQLLAQDTLSSFVRGWKHHTPPFPVSDRASLTPAYF